MTANWSPTYGAAARQKTVGQELTICKLDVGERVTLNSTFDENEDVIEPNLGKLMSVNLLTITKTTNTIETVMQEWRSMK